MSAAVGIAAAGPGPADRLVDADRPVVAELTDRVRAASVVVGAAVAALGVLGFVNSFEKVRRAARPIFGGLDWTVPVGIDLGIGVFSALGIVLALLNMPIRWLRLVPWSLVGVTVYLNVAGESTLFARVAHAVLPCLWVVAVEVGTHAVKVRAGLAAGTSMDSIRLSRWLLAPVATAGLQRRMILWEVRSYPQALRLEAARRLALCELQDSYGRWSWRWKAPRRARTLYRLGAAVPAGHSISVPALAEGERLTDQGPASTPPAISAPSELALDELRAELLDELRRMSDAMSSPTGRNSDVGSGRNSGVRSGRNSEVRSGRNSGVRGRRTSAPAAGRRTPARGSYGSRRGQVDELMTSLGISRSRAYDLVKDPEALAAALARAAGNGNSPRGAT